MYAINIRANKVKWFMDEKNEPFVDEFVKLKQTELYKNNHERKWYCDGTIAIDQVQTADGVENLIVASLCVDNVQDLMNLLKADGIIHKELQPLVKIVEKRVNKKWYSEYCGSSNEFFPFDQLLRCRRCKPIVDPFR